MAKEMRLRNSGFSFILQENIFSSHVYPENIQREEELDFSIEKLSACKNLLILLNKRIFFLKGNIYLRQTSLMVIKCYVKRAVATTI